VHRFQTLLVPGTREPYRSWTFLLIPPEMAVDWGPGQKVVCGYVSGRPFQGTASRGEGVWRVPIPREFRESAGITCGTTVEAALELDLRPRLVSIPDELQAIFRTHPEVAAMFDQLAPSMRRAWAEYVSEAKRPETRIRRANAAPDGIRTRNYPR